MNIKHIESTLQNYHHFTLEELLAFYNISILEENTLPMNTDAMLINMNTLFMKKNLDISYQNFLILHELGHRILHYDQNISFNFSIRIKKNKLEREANTFACLFLLKDEEISNTNIINLLTTKGVPENIAFQFFDDLYSKGITI
ncbi:ImmA/IrrE family metallo-endopeptidase [Breznakia sp. OttesenSCG-928-G09]|nr:ImmA/IrrE family metallo-endopeptidase [Breznakia sp. OttesenSCG-928-G09]